MRLATSSVDKAFFSFCVVDTQKFVCCGNHIVTDEPIDFEGKDHIALTEDTSPNFMGQDISFAQYATNETEQMLPLPLVLAHNICREIDIQKRKFRLRGVMPDGKAQVTIEYEDGKAKRIKTILKYCRQ